MANKLEQRAYEPNTEISDTSKRQPVSRGKKLGYIAAGVVAAGLVVGIGYKINKTLEDLSGLNVIKDYCTVAKEIFK